MTNIFLCFPTADKKLSGKRTKTENSESTSVKLENSSLEKTTTFKNGGKNLSNYWLKPEPENRLEKGTDMKFSIEDLKAQPKQTACWGGVCNYQVRKQGAGTPESPQDTSLPPPPQSAGAGLCSQTLLSPELSPGTLNKGTDVPMNRRKVQTCYLSQGNKTEINI